MTIQLEKNGQWEALPATEGENLYSVLLKNGTKIEAPCGGRCFCGKCRVRVEGSCDATPGERGFLSGAQIAAGYRLACAVTVSEGMRVTLDGEYGAEIQAEGGIAAAETNPVITVRTIETRSATLAYPADELTRIEELTGALDMPEPVVLTELNRPYKVLYDERRLLAGRAERAAYGVAVDIGTTTVVAYLMDLLSGTQIGVATAINAQRSYGADVITRCGAAETQLTELSRAIRSQIAGMIAELCGKNNITKDDIYHVAFAGNTVMLHLLLGAPVGGIAVSPFAPVFARGYDLRAEALELGCPRAVATLLPCIAGYVGADTVGAALACDIDKGGAPRLIVDIGTNGEMVLAANGTLLCCSTAAGPAFEGAHIACGIGGVEGAIAKVSLEGGEFAFSTIGGGEAIGLCGSGLVDAVAALLSAGYIDETGRFDDEKQTDRFFDLDGKMALRLCGDVYLTQKDLREVQLAKAAIAAGIEILLKEAGLRTRDVAATYLAGGFGSHIDPKSACAIGLLPKELLPTLRAVGNAAGAGARIALLDKNARQRAEAMRKNMRYIELSLRVDFQDLYIENMLFPS